MSTPEEFKQAINDGEFKEAMMIHDKLPSWLIKFDIYYDLRENFELFQYIYFNHPDKMEFLINWSLRYENEYYLDFICQNGGIPLLVYHIGRSLYYQKEELPTFSKNMDYLFDTHLDKNQKKDCLMIIFGKHLHKGYFREFIVKYQDILDDKLINKIIEELSSEKFIVLLESNLVQYYPESPRKLLEYCLGCSDDLTSYVVKHFDSSIMYSISIEDIYLYRLGNIKQISQRIKYLEQNGITIRFIQSDYAMTMKKLLDEHM